MNRVYIIFFVMLYVIEIRAWDNVKLPVYNRLCELTLNHSALNDNVLQAVFISNEVEKTYMVSFMPDVNISDTMNLNPVSIHNFYSWSIYVYCTNHSNDTKLEVIYRYSWDCSMLPPKNPFIKEQVEEIDLLIKRNRQEVSEYITSSLKNEISKFNLVTQSHEIYKLPLFRYYVIPNSYNKNYIYWEDLWNEETWKEK